VYGTKYTEPTLRYLKDVLKNKNPEEVRRTLKEHKKLNE